MGLFAFFASFELFILFRGFFASFVNYLNSPKDSKVEINQCSHGNESSGNQTSPVNVKLNVVGIVTQFCGLISYLVFHLTVI